MVVSTYQAASGAGAAAMEELELQTREVWSISYSSIGNFMWWKTGLLVFDHKLSFFFLLLRYWKENHQHVKYLTDRYVMLIVPSLMILKFRNCFLMNFLFCSMLLICSHTMHLFFRTDIMKKKWNWSRRQGKFG